MGRIIPWGVVPDLDDEESSSNLAPGSNAGFQNLQTYPLLAGNELYWWEQFKTAHTDAERGVAVDALTRISLSKGLTCKQTLFAFDDYARDRRCPFNREEAWRWILKVYNGNPPWEARVELEKAKGEQVHFTSAAELCSWNPSPSKWLVEKLILEKILCMIGGFAKDGKTTLVSQLILDCLRGAHFLGLKTTKSRIAYFAVEETHRTVCDRLKKMGLREDDYLRTHFFPLTIDENVIKEITTKCMSEAIDTIIIDTMGSAFDLEDENKSAEMTRKIKLLLQLRDAGFTVIVVHHTGKGDNKEILKGFRGSSAIVALIDQALMLVPGKGNQRKLVVRGRYNSDCIDEMLLDFQNGRYVRLESQTKKKEKDRATVILDFLKLNKDQTVKQMVEGKLGSDGKIRKILDQLVAENKVSQSTLKKKGGPKAYNAL